MARAWSRHQSQTANNLDIHPATGWRRESARLRSRTECSRRGNLIRIKALPATQRGPDTSRFDHSQAKEIARLTVTEYVFGETNMRFGRAPLPKLLPKFP